MAIYSHFFTMAKLTNIVKQSFVPRAWWVAIQQGVSKKRRPLEIKHIVKI